MKRFTHFYSKNVLIRSTKGSFFLISSVFYANSNNTWHGLETEKDLFLSPKWFLSI